MHIEPTSEAPRPQRAGRPDELRSSAGQARTVLVIDDDEGIRTALAEILELSGYVVAAAEDGQQATELLEGGFVPSAIVLDLMMPRMDGWTFLDRLRSDPRYRDVPVLVTTAFAAEWPPGADACLQKPFEIAQLHREVARLCLH